MFDLFNESDKPVADGLPFQGETPGYGEVIGKGIMRGGVRVAKGVATLVAPLVPWGDEADPQAFLKSEHYLPRKEDFFHFADETMGDAEKYWSVNPDTMTTSRRIVGGLAELPLALAAGPAGFLSPPVTVGMDLVDKGVDPTTATLAAVGNVAATGLMVGMPQAGRTIKETIGLILANPAMGAGQDYLTKQLLEAKGYHDQAQMFDPFDPAARSVDLILGGVFGGLHAYGKWKETKAPSLVQDSIDVVEGVKQRDSLNPFPAGSGLAEGHLDALTKATEDINAGRPVDVTGKVLSADESRVAPEEERTPAEKTPEELLKEEAAKWAKDKVSQGQTQFMKQIGEPLTDYVKRLEKDYLRLKDTDVHPEVKEARHTVIEHAKEMAAELDQMAGIHYDQGGEKVTGPAPGDLSEIQAQLYENPDIVKHFTDSPENVAGVLADFLHAEATALERADSGKIVMDGHAKEASWSDAPPWYLEQNAALRDQAKGKRLKKGEPGYENQGTGAMSKKSVVNALRKTADGMFRTLTAGQQDMVLSALDSISRQIQAHGQEIHNGELRVGDRFAEPDLGMRTVVGERDGLLVLDNGRQILKDSTQHIVGEVDRAGRIENTAGMDPLDYAVERRLTEGGDISLNDGTGQDGQPTYRSAREYIDEAKNDLAKAQSQDHLFKAAAVCLHLG